MALIESKQKLFFDLKKAQPVNFSKLTRIQDSIEILKVSENGIFKISEGLYSKTYLMDDVNYESMGYEDQVLFYAEWCKIIDSFSTSFKITIVNQRRSMEQVKKKILYPMKDNEYDEVREVYNDVIYKRIVEDKKGIEQKKYLTVTIKVDSYEDAVRYFQRTEPSIIKSFDKVGVRLHDLNGNERLYPIYCFYRQGMEDHYNVDIKKCIQTGTDWKNDVAPGFITFKKDKFVTERMVGQAMYIDPASYGASFKDNFFDELVGVETCGVFSVDYIPIPQDWLKTTLENKYMAVEGKIVKQQNKRKQQKNFISDITYNVRMEKEEIEKLLTEMRTDNARMLWVGVTALITAENETELEKFSTSLQKICTDNSCVMKPCNNLQREGINTALPIGVRNHAFMRGMFTRMAGGFIPFKVMEAIEYDNPMYYGANYVSHNPILKNRKKLKNPNGFVLGSSGSGKSFTGAKMEIGSVFLNTNDDIIIVDPQNEFDSTVALFNGSYINLDTNAKEFVNPLDIDLEKLKTKKGLDEVIREKRQMMYSIAEHSMEGETPFGVGTLVGRCVRELYQDIAKMPEEKRYVPIMEDLYKYFERQVVKEREDGNKIKAEVAEKLSISMERFVDGSLDIYNHQTNVNPNNRVVAYGMRDLGEDLWSVSISIMLSAIRRRVYENYKNGKATRIYLDECHYMTKTPYSTAYIIEAYKTFRKFGGIVTGLTQNISDLLKSRDMATLLSNSEYTMFMSQAPKDIELILDTFDGVTREQLKYVRDAEPGTGLVRFGSVYIPMDNRMDPSVPLYSIFTTNMHEKVAEQR